MPNKQNTLSPEQQATRSVAEAAANDHKRYPGGRLRGGHVGKVSVRELSRRTGFSPATVSNALNNKRGVSKETAEIIQKAANELGYRRNGKLNRVQFVIARQSGRMIDEGTFRLAVINGIEYEARQHGISTTYVTLELSNEHTRERQIADLLGDANGGIVLLGTEMVEADYDLFAHANVPLVVVDGQSDNHFLESIVFSNEGSAYRAVRRLIEAGHREIGYLGGGLRIRNFPLRERGYLRALREAGLPVRDEYKVLLGTDKPETACNDMLRWLSHDPKLPTAFFADNDALAVGAMRALSETGHPVPDEVSIIGFDDLDYASVAHPPLSTVHVPRFDIGRMAVERLIEQAEHRRAYSCVTHVSTTLVERESVRTIS